MKRILQAAFLLSLWLFLVGCGNLFAGGGSSGTEAGNALSLVVVNEQGVPAARVAVTLRPATYSPGDSIDTRYTLVTGKVGEIFFSGLSQGDWILEASDSTSAFLVPIHITSTDSVVELGRRTLLPHSVVVGSIPTPVALGTRIVVLGTEHTAIPNSSGTFRMEHVPCGTLVVQARVANGALSGYAEAEPGQLSQVGLLHDDASSTIVLDDFSDSNSQHRLAPVVGEGWWWLDGSADVVIQRAASTASFPVPLAYEDSHGMIVRFSASFDSAGLSPWLDLGVQLGLQGHSYDLTHVDSVAFMICGQGKALFTLHIANQDSTLGLPQYVVQIPSTWTRVVVPLDQIDADRSQVLKISWVFTSNVDVRLDDVTLIGATRQQIWGVP